MISKALIAGAYHGKLREMVRMGVELTLILPRTWGKQVPEIFEATDYKINVVPCTFSGHNHFHFYHSRVDLLDFDLVHIDEDPWSLVTYQWMRMCVRHRKPALFFTWQNIYKRYPPPFGHFEKYSYKHAVAGIAGNDEVRQVLQKKNFSGPIAVIPQFGIDPDFFRRIDVNDLRLKLGLQGKFVIGFVGRMVPGKGIDDLVRTLPLLPKDCALLMLGDGPSRQEADRLALQLAVADRVVWINHVNSLKVPEYMNLLNALVLPSRTLPMGKILPTGAVKEQFGRVLVEAMACEIPVVGSSSGEISNVVGPGGLIFPEGDVPSLSRHLIYLHDNANEAAQMGIRGRARVLEKFTHQRIARDTVDLYTGILSNSFALACMESNLESVS